MKFRLAALISFMSAACSGGGACAQTVEDFYRGRQLEIIVGSTPGGDYDLWGRVLAHFMGSHLPGRPNIIVRNMPGAGTMAAANYIFSQAPRDGTVLGLVSRNMPTQEVLGNTAVRFKTAEFNWIGSPEQTKRICVAIQGATVQKAEDLFANELIVGGVAGTAITTTPMLMEKLLGMKFKVINGYPGGSEIYLAMEKREVDGLCQTWAAIEGAHPGWLNQGKIRVLFNLEAEPIAELGVPSIHQFAKTDEQKRIISFYNSNAELGRPVMTSPGVPHDRVEALRRAFDATMQDPELLAEAARTGLRVQSLTGEQVARVAEQIAATPKSIIDATVALVGNLGD